MFVRAKSKKLIERERERENENGKVMLVITHHNIKNEMGGV